MFTVRLWFFHRLYNEELIHFPPRSVQVQSLVQSMQKGLLLKMNLNTVCIIVGRELSSENFLPTFEKHTCYSGAIVCNFIETCFKRIVQVSEMKLE